MPSKPWLVSVVFLLLMLLVAVPGVLTRTPEVSIVDKGIDHGKVQSSVDAIVGSLTALALGLLAGLAFLASDKLNAKFIKSTHMQLSAAFSAFCAILSIYVGYMSRARMLQVSLGDETAAPIINWVGNQAFLLFLATTAAVFFFVASTEE